MSNEEDAEYKTRRQIALALDWMNVPPLDVLVKDIRARAAGDRRIKLEHEKMLNLLVHLRANVQLRPHREKEIDDLIKEVTTP